MNFKYTTEVYYMNQHALKVKAFLLTFLFAGVLFAKAEKYSVDQEHTTIGFKIKHFGISSVTGKFKKYDVDLQWDTTDPLKSAVTATIDTKSIDTGIDKRDNHLRSDDFFKTEKFPTMTFKGKKVMKVKCSKEQKDEEYTTCYNVMGDLTLLSTTKEVTLNVGAQHIEDEWKNKRLGVSATTKINREDFGMKLTEGFLSKAVGKQVTITINLEAVKKPDAEKVPEKK